MTGKASLDKIKKLIRLSSSPYAGEAQAAADKALHLMTKYGICVYDVKLLPEPVDPKHLSRFLLLIGHDTALTLEPQSNWFTGNPYGKGNSRVLKARGFSIPYWIGPRQSDQCGGHVIHGEEPTTIYFWRGEGAWGESYVFNLEQIEGLDWRNRQAYPSATVR